MDKKDIKDSDKEIVYFGDIIIIHSTNVETVCSLSQKTGYEMTSQEVLRRRYLSTLFHLHLLLGYMENGEAVNNILGILFPRIKTAVGISYGMGRDYARRDYLINNKIAVPECFDRYFALVLETDAISTAMIKRLIYESDETDLSEGIMQLYQEGKIIRLLEEIEAYANSGGASTSISVERASLIIKNLARNWGRFEVDDRGLISVPFAWRLLFCVDPLLKVMDSTTRFSCIHSVFKDKDVQPSTLALLLNDFETQHGRFTEKTISGDDTTFSLDEVLKLEQVFKNRAVEALDSGEALRQYQGLNFLWMLGQIDAGLVANKKESIISDDVSLIKIISYCTSRGTVIARTGLKMRDVNRNAVKEFIDVDEAYRRVKAFVATSQFYLLPKDDQMNAIAFILIMERTGTETILENGIAEDAVIKVLDQLAILKQTDRQN